MTINDNQFFFSLNEESNRKTTFDFLAMKNDEPAYVIYAANEIGFAFDSNSGLIKHGEINVIKPWFDKYNEIANKANKAGIDGLNDALRSLSLPTFEDRNEQIIQPLTLITMTADDAMNPDIIDLMNKFVNNTGYIAKWHKERINYEKTIVILTDSEPVEPRKNSARMLNHE